MENVTITKTDYEELVRALDNAVTELGQWHDCYERKCPGGCPTIIYMEEGKKALATALRRTESQAFPMAIAADRA